MMRIYLFSVFVGQGVSIGKIYLFHLCTPFLIVHLIREISTNKCFLSVYRKEVSFVSLFAAYCTLSLFWSSSAANSLVPLVQWIMSLSVVVLVPYCLYFIGLRKSMAFLSVLVMVHLGLSLLETLNIVRWPISPYSTLSTYFLKTTYQDYGPADIRGAWFSPSTSFFWNPNNSAFVTLLLFPSLLLLKSRWKVVGLGVSCIIVYFSESKSILVLLVVMIFFYLLKGWKYLLIAPLLLFFLFDFIGNKLRLSWEVFKGYLNGLIYILEIFYFNLKYDDLKIHDMVRERFTLINQGLSHVRGHLFFGRGVGFLHDKTFIYENRELSLSTIHNSLIEIFIELGIIGLSMVFLGLGSLYTSLFRSSLLYRKHLILMLTISLIALPVLSTVRYFLIYFGFLGGIIFMVRPQAGYEQQTPF
jgi:teichuronic acid biosynthesis protein TuaE